MKRLISILFIIFIHSNFCYGQDAFYSNYAWERLAELTIMLLEETNEEKITSINHELLDVTRLIYDNFDKKEYKSENYSKLCMNLISLYISNEDYKNAEIIINRSEKRIKNESALLRLQIKRALVYANCNNFIMAERAISEIRLKVELMRHNEYALSLDECAILLDYNALCVAIQTNVINTIGELFARNRFSDIIELLESKKVLFEKDILSNKEKIALNQQMEYATDGVLSSSLPMYVDAKIFVYSTLAKCYNHIGDYVNADRYIFECESSIFEQDLISIELLSHMYLELGEYFYRNYNRQRANLYYLKCSNMVKFSDNEAIQHLAYRAHMMNLLLLSQYGNVNDIDKIQKESATIMKIYLSDELYRTRLRMDILLIATDIFSEIRDYSTCAYICESAIMLLSEANDIPDKSTYIRRFQTKLSSYYTLMGEYKYALKILNNIPLEEYTSSTYFTKSSIEYHLKNYAAAITSLQSSLDAQEINEPIQNFIRGYSALVSTAIEAKLEIDIKRLYFDFIYKMRIGEVVNTNTDRGEYIGYFQVYAGLFYYYCILNNIHIEVAYDMALFLKGYQLRLDTIFQSQIYKTGNAEIISIYDRLIEERKNISSDKVYETERRLMNLLPKLQTEEIQWKYVRNALKPESLSIEFIDYIIDSDKSIYAALLLRKDWDAPKMIQLFELSELEKLITSDVSKAYSGYQGKEIQKLIWSKIEPYMNEGDNIYFSPSGKLHHLAIESLPTEDGRIMSEKYNMYRLSSTKELLSEKPEPKYNRAVLYGGLIYDVDDEQMIVQSRSYAEHKDVSAIRCYDADTTYRSGWGFLNGSESEIKNISKNLSEKNIQCTIFKGIKGNEESFLALSGQNNQIIHIATHGFFLPVEKARIEEYFQMMGSNTLIIDNSMKRSGLILAGGNKAWKGEAIPKGIEDGVLTAEEIRGLDLRGVDLVVLSACETGLGDVTGEGVFGLQRAFKNAGAQTIIMSLWQVSDQATELMMSEFYKNLSIGRSKRESFLIAQKRVKQKFDNNPYYWAAFIMLD